MHDERGLSAAVEVDECEALWLAWLSKLFIRDAIISIFLATA